MVRHPMYAGVVPLLLGMPLWLQVILAKVPVIVLAESDITITTLPHVSQRRLLRRFDGTQWGIGLDDSEGFFSVPGLILRIIFWR
jgi:hypothetical protein